MTTHASLRACGVRVPCSTSNLGAGFDCIGLAFNRYLDAAYRPGTGDLAIQRHGTLRRLDTELSNCVYDRLASAFIAGLRSRGITRAGGTIIATSTIPIARGLGSSASATVAGLALAAAACGDEFDRDATLAAALHIEGHPDNAAPSLFGGLVAIAYDDLAGTPRVLRLPLDEGIGFAFAAPSSGIPTARARAVLPADVPHDAAARGLGRMAALLYGLAHADASAIRIGFTDELHVPYRLPLIADAAEAMDAASRAGAWAATISGSGSGLIAACPPDAAEAVVRAMMDVFDRTAAGVADSASDANDGGDGGDGGDRAIGFVATPDTEGTRPVDPDSIDIDSIETNSIDNNSTSATSIGAGKARHPRQVET